MVYYSQDIIARTETIRFISLIHQKTVAPIEIEYIRQETFKFGFFIVGTKKVKIRLLNLFKG
jgi:hypothetical protein